MTKSMAFRQVRGVVIAAHTDRDPSEEEYNGYCDFCLGLPKHVNRYLIVSEGGAPTPKQRASTNETLKKRGQPEATVAVVTPKTIVRGIVTALSWFNPKIKSFAPTEIDVAMRYLGLSPTEAGEVSLELRKLQAELKR